MSISTFESNVFLLTKYANIQKITPLVFDFSVQEITVALVIVIFLMILVLAIILIKIPKTKRFVLHEFFCTNIIPTSYYQ